MRAPGRRADGELLHPARALQHEGHRVRLQQHVEEGPVGEDEGQRHLLRRRRAEPVVHAGRRHRAPRRLHRRLGPGPRLARAELLEGQARLEQPEGLGEVEPGMLPHERVRLVEAPGLLGVQLLPNPDTASSLPARPWRCGPGRALARRARRWPRAWAAWQGPGTADGPRVRLPGGAAGRGGRGAVELGRTGAAGVAGGVPGAVGVPASEWGHRWWAPGGGPPRPSADAGPCGQPSPGFSRAGMETRQWPASRTRWTSCTPPWEVTASTAVLPSSERTES